MSLRTVLVIVLALMCGGSAAVGINTFRHQAPASANPELVSVVVAATDIARGSTISADSVTTRDYPKDLVPPGALTNQSDAVERVAFNALLKGEPVVDAKLAAKGAGRGLAALIPVGMRAFTIQTTSVVSGVAGFILPGNRVDVLLTVSSQGGANDQTGGGTTIILLQNVEVLAVDQRLQAPAENKNNLKELQSVTLLVTPDEAQKLDLGQNKGVLHLTLRHPDDALAANARPATVSGLRVQPQKPWDERTRAVLDALGSALAKMPRATKSEKVPAPAEPLSVPVAEEPPAPAKHFQRIMNGASVSKTTFTLDDDGNVISTETDTTQPDRPANKPAVKPAPKLAGKKS
jgi:pilus assembly protein CpaB